MPSTDAGIRTDVDLYAMYSVILSSLDYCNALLHGAPTSSCNMYTEQAAWPPRAADTLCLRPRASISRPGDLDL